MSVHPRAGEPASERDLIDVDRLLGEYYARQPDLSDPGQLVSFGTSGHRGSALDGAFNEAHIVAITQAICEYRQEKNITGPLFVGRDTHALSRPAERTALEVLAAAKVETVVEHNDGPVPTPIISHAILNHNRKRKIGQADGIVITPSHNPPRDGGFKYNPPHGGPADTGITRRIQERANALLRQGVAQVKRIPFARALRSKDVHKRDLLTSYLKDLKNVIDFDVIRSSGISLGADPLGGAAISCWGIIAEMYDLSLTVVNDKVDPTFRFLSLDRDGQIRMDCSSPYAMASLVQLKDKYDIAFGNDTDADRHGIVTPTVGLLNPNHFLSVAIQYLFSYRDNWPGSAAIGKTLVSSNMIDRVAKALGRKVVEVPVGFKWFVAGLHDGALGFGGEESAGASFLRQNGTVWTTDKDGIILCLLAAEITARTGKDPGMHYRELTERFGTPFYTRVDQPATREQKDTLKKLAPHDVAAATLAGETILARLTTAPGNNESIGGLKVVTENGWFAARPSGTEDVYKIYAESFKSEEHLQHIVSEANQIVATSLKNR